MIDPRDIDPDTGRPYANYSSPSLDTSFHDDEDEDDEVPAMLEALRDAHTALDGIIHPSCRKPGDLMDRIETIIARIDGNATDIDESKLTPA